MELMDFRKLMQDGLENATESDLDSLVRAMRHAARALNELSLPLKDAVVGFLGDFFDPCLKGKRQEKGKDYQTGYSKTRESGTPERILPSCSPDRVYTMVQEANCQRKVPLRSPCLIDR